MLTCSVFQMVNSRSGKGFFVAFNWFPHSVLIAGLQLKQVKITTQTQRLKSSAFGFESGGKTCRAHSAKLPCGDFSFSEVLVILVLLAFERSHEPLPTVSYVDSLPLKISRIIRFRR